MRISSGSMDTKNDADRYTTTLILPDVITKPKDRTLKKVLTLLDTGATLKLWKRRHSWWSKERWLPNQQRDSTPQRPDRSKGSKNGNRLRHHPDSYCPRQTPSLLLKTCESASSQDCEDRSFLAPKRYETGVYNFNAKQSGSTISFSRWLLRQTQPKDKIKFKRKNEAINDTQDAHWRLLTRENRSRRVQWRRSKTPTTRPATSGLMSETKKNPVQSNDVAEERAGENEKRWNHRKSKWFILQLSSPACQKSMWRIPNMRRYAVAEFEFQWICKKIQMERGKDGRKTKSKKKCNTKEGQLL